MGRLIRPEKVEEGTIFNSWIYNRLIRNNKNVLTAITGPTGSGKSYQDLRRAELWYKYFFKEEFPAENICFSISEVMKRISSKKLRRGEILILEEAGANLGSLDFQSKVSKLFTYVLQSFRSLNIALFFNLPYLSMLNKQARLLIHVHFETCGIDNDKKLAKSKGFFRQVNQGTGKVYQKYLRAKIDKRLRVIKRFNYELPSKRLLKIYEAKKFKFVNDLTLDFSEQLDKIEKDQMRKMARPTLTDRQMQVYNYLLEGYNQTQIAKMLGLSFQRISDIKKSVIKNGFNVKIKENPLGNQHFNMEKPIPAAF